MPPLTDSISTMWSRRAIINSSLFSSCHCRANRSTSSSFDLVWSNVVWTL